MARKEITMKTPKTKKVKFVQLIANPYGIAGLTDDGRVFLYKEPKMTWIEIPISYNYKKLGRGFWGEETV